MAELNTATLSDFTKNAEIMFLKSLDSVPQVARESGLFKEKEWGDHTGDTREFSEIDLEEYASNKDEGDQAERAQVQQGYSKEMTLVRRAKDIGITYEMRKRNKYNEVVSRLKNLGKLVPNRMDLDLSHRISFAASTSYTNMEGDSVDVSVGDGYALAYSGHTVKGSSDTYRNILANNPRLSKGAIEGMERLIAEETMNQFGEKMSMPFDILWTTDNPNSVNTAREYLQSTADVEGPHSGVENVYKGKYRHIVLPRVDTDANGKVDTSKRYYWGLASSQMSSAFLAVPEETHMKIPADLNAGEDFATDDWNYGVRGKQNCPCKISSYYGKILTDYAEDNPRQVLIQPQRTSEETFYLTDRMKRCSELYGNIKK